jgi:hypothetical protein
VDSCFSLFFSLYPPGDHSLNPFHLVEDGLMDNNLEAASPEAAGLGTSSLDDSGTCYFVADFFALPKTEPACHVL